MQTNVTAAGECLIDTTQPECASAWCDENRVERDVDYDGPLADRMTSLGVSLLVVDYRGFGWSEGSPRLATAAAVASMGMPLGMLASSLLLDASFGAPNFVYWDSAPRACGQTHGISPVL